jgi:delta8-fatty-acid desaturase
MALDRERSTPRRHSLPLPCSADSPDPCRSLPVAAATDVVHHTFTAPGHNIAVTTMGGSIWDRRKVADHVLRGDSVVIYRGQVLNISSSWLDAHPGGKLAILHFVGRDATDEIDAFHDEIALRKVRAFTAGHLDEGEKAWQPLVPPIMSGWVRRIGLDGQQAWYNEAAAVRSSDDMEISPFSQILLVDKQTVPTQDVAPSIATLTPPPSALSLIVQARHSAAYKELHEQITQAGLYQCHYLTGYGPEVARYLLLAAVSAIAYKHSWFMTSALFLGALWHQLVFTVHDLGHMGVTHNWSVDRTIAILIADFIGGLSIGWWVDVSVSLLCNDQIFIYQSYRIITFIIVSVDFVVCSTI